MAMMPDAEGVGQESDAHRVAPAPGTPDTNRNSQLQLETLSGERSRGAGSVWNGLPLNRLAQHNFIIKSVSLSPTFGLSLTKKKFKTQHI